MDCLLCKREVVTKLYYEDSKIWIVDCKTCQVPMVVWKKHTVMVNDLDYDYIVKKVRSIFGEIGYIIDDCMKTIKHHYHLHLRGGYY